MLALYVAAIGISGSILVFKDQLLPRPRLSIPARNLRACTPQALADAIDQVNHSNPGRQAYLASCPDEADPFFAVTTRRSPKDSSKAREVRGVDPLTVYLNPVNGRIVGAMDLQKSWIEWVDRFHVDLFLGPSGRQWNGVGAAFLLALVITGMVLWWPGVERWRQALLIRRRRTWKRLVWNLHSVMGFWTVLFTLMWATTAIYFAWPRPFTAAIRSISPVVTGQYPAAELSRLAPPADEPVTFDLLTVLRHAMRASPRGALEGCFYGTGPRAIFTIYMARGQMGDYAKTDFIYFDRHSGALLYIWRRGENKTLGDLLLWLAVPLHFGTSWGLAVRIVWAAVGLALPLLAFTGLLMYWNRFLSRKWRASQSGTSR